VYAPTSTIIDRYTARIRVAWTGGDYRVAGATTSGIRYYEVHRRLAGGSWVSLGTTTSTAKSFTGSRRHTYDIRVRSRDRAGNWSAWRLVRISI
jgi:hypothetical protein